MRVVRELRGMVGIVVTENECGIRALIMVHIHQALHTALHLDQLSKMQARVVGEIEVAANQSGMLTPCV